MTQYQTYSKGGYRGIADLTETERHRLLATERRRILISILSASLSPMGMETLARRVVKREADRMKGLLHHTAIPMMKDLGIIEVNPETSQLKFADNWSY